MRLSLLSLFLFMGQLALVFAWQSAPRSLTEETKRLVGSSDQINRPRDPSPKPPFDVRWTNRAILLSKRDAKINGTKLNTTAEIVDSEGEDIWDGDITNEDMRDILNDRFGLLAVTLGVLAIILICLIILTLTLAYKTEKRQIKAYKELYEL